MSQTDRRTDDMRSQDHDLYHSASRGKNYIHVPFVDILARMYALSLDVNRL